MRLKFYRRLRFQVVIIVVFFIILPMVLLFTLLSNTIKETFNEKYNAVARQSIQETGDKLNFLLRDIEAYTTTILADQTFLERAGNPETSPQALNESLRGFLASRNTIDGIALITKTHSYSVGTNKTTPFISVQQLSETQRYSKPIWISTVRQNIKILSGISVRYYFSVVRNIVDFNTLEHYGTLLIDVDEMLLEQSYSNLASDGGEIFIIDTLGNIVSHPDKSRIGGTVTTAPYYAEMMGASSPVNSIAYHSGDSDEIAFYSTLETNGWHIVKTISKDDLYFEITQIQKIVIIGAGIYGTLILMFLLGFSLQYTNPMLQIIDDLKRVEKGDLSVRTAVHTKNEIRELSDGINHMIDEMEELIDKLVAEERLKRAVQLEALHAQINPHFLYNTLNTIKWMAKIQGANSVSNAIVALVKLLRISINISSDFIRVEEELEYIRNYVVIQKLRFNEDFTITYTIPSECEALLIPKLILQPIIENSMLYGAGTVDVLNIQVEGKLYTEDELLTLSVIDNGPGIDPEILEHLFEETPRSNTLSKAGLNNVNQRIKLFCGDAYGLEIMTAPESGTRVVVKLPIMAASNNGGSNV